MTQTETTSVLDPRKFRDPDLTADGDERAHVGLTKLDTLWFNTGTLCNLECVTCYIESSPRNDRLVDLTADEVAYYLDEIESENWETREIGFTGGEPFMNPDIIPMMEDSLRRGFEVLVLTNAMKPMSKCTDELLRLHKLYGAKLTLRVSVDHYTQQLHEEERGPRSWGPMLEGLKWLSHHGFHIAAAGRTRWGDDEADLRQGYGRLFVSEDIAIDADHPAQLVLFPELDDQVDVPEITTACWGILDQSPDDVMCASSRMVVRRKGADLPVVLSCTLLPYDEAFEMGTSLAEASAPLKLNHPHCAKFCVLGGASCSA
ncbi:MAG: radical SAM protein [Candidatus Latescibacterota bacterium]|nr:radical SAM protein [Candidatus Latescibacterota bacterium]MED5414755.1 radical SAM protein [Candidatus Latescibacterota bacterium]MEE3041201.1 radical SAM protein [Candidatus Latescibacterota bacterium]MEE3336247.1 radical SAM protein [Candidatus Latescibacterota bacterium]